MSKKSAIPNRALPIGDAEIFKSLLTREYAKGLALTQELLLRHPNHGESLAMRGVFLCNLDRKPEGYTSVKAGVRLDMTSSICWHVYGLIYRADKNYKEASKCYQQAMKLDGNNLQILRDYALLQVQTRKYDQLISASQSLLQAKPTIKAYWMGLAVAYHLAKNYSMALEIFNSYYDTIAEEAIDVEAAEAYLYRSRILEESGDLEGCLKDLEMVETKVCDRSGWQGAKVLLKLGKHEEAHIIYKVLFYHNPDSKFYLTQLIESKHLAATALYLDELAIKYPRSNPLKHASIRNAETENQLASLLVEYLQSSLRKGVPSLFNSIKDMYQVEWKAKLIQTIVFGFVETLTAFSSFTTEQGSEYPTVLLWSLYLLAQSYSAINNNVAALSTVLTAIKHTPTLVELYMLKARILKRSGDLVGAAVEMNFARKLDLQDRYVNSKATKYYLRCDDIPTAIATISLFTKANVDPIDDLVDMQCFWFLTELAESHARLSNHGQALKHFHKIDKIFDDISDDQFDFHSYSVRKCVLRAYVDMIELMDRSHGHAYYVRAMRGAVNVFLRLDGLGVDEASYLLEATRISKDAIVVRDQEAKERSERLVRERAEKGETKDEDENVKEIDTDPHGLRFLNTDFLGEARKSVTVLTKYAPERADSWTLTAKIHTASGELALATSALLRASAIDHLNTDVVKIVNEDVDTLDAATKEDMVSLKHNMQF